MSLKTFIEKTRRLSTSKLAIDGPTDRAARVLAQFFCGYLARFEADPSLLCVGSTDWRFTENLLPAIVCDGIEELAVSENKEYASLRYQYLLHQRLPIVSLEGLEATHPKTTSLARSNLVRIIERFVEDTAGQSAAKRVERYINTPLYALRHSFDGFLRAVYRKGLYALVKHHARVSRESRGAFGRTTLTTYVADGEVRITFSRTPLGRKANELRLVRFCVSDTTRGTNPEFFGCDVDLKTALAMIEDVRTHWPSEEQRQRKVFRAHIARCD